MQRTWLSIGIALFTVSLGSACKTSSADQVALPAATATPAPAAAPAATSTTNLNDYSDISGPWGFETDWGQVSINDKVGSYTDTFGNSPGHLALTRTGERTYSVVWSESPKRHGTMTLTLSDDARRLTGHWAPDPDVTVGGKTGGSVSWFRH